MRAPLLFGYLLLSIAILAGAVVRGTPASPERPRPFLPLQDCRLEHSERLHSIGARCASFEVAENPGEARGKRIALKVAVVPAVNRNGARDPLFVLSGGPGQAATEFYVQAAGAFARVQRERDIVLVDQRGTGGSNALTCEFPDDAVAAQMSAEQIGSLTRRCLQSLPGDPVYYTTSVAVKDLDAVRAALGYQRINLYGISYGTRVAQHYLRRYPVRVRTVILDGVVPPEQVLGVDSALQAQRALDLILERCRTNEACHKAFPEPASDLAALRQRLTRSSAEVSFPDPVTAAATDSAFRLVDLQTVVRLLSYSSEQAALLPLLLHEAAAGNLAPLAAQSQMIEDELQDALSIGMHNAVVCTEDAPFFEAAKPDRVALENSYLGTSQLDLLRQMCAVWPRGVIDADFHAALATEAPVLLLSGSADPVTPPAYAEQALRKLHNGLHVVLQGQGHGQFARGCIPNLMARFLERGQIQGLDTTCARQTAPAPFFLTFSGPQP